MLDFYDAGLVRQIATNLFYGWGYNFYKRENQLRADDQMVRSKCVALLNEAASAVAGAEAHFRRERLPPPTRRKPFPDTDAVAGAQALERLHASITGVAARVQSAPTPGNDRVFQRFREQDATLSQLLERDTQLVGLCDMLRSSVAGKEAEWLLEHLPQLETGTAFVQAALLRREQFLIGQPG